MSDAGKIKIWFYYATEMFLDKEVIERVGNAVPITLDIKKAIWENLRDPLSALAMQSR